MNENNIVIGSIIEPDEQITISNVKENDFLVADTNN